MQGSTNRGIKWIILTGHFPVYRAGERQIPEGPIADECFSNGPGLNLDLGMIFHRD